MKAFLDGLRALGPARLAALAAVAVGVLAMLALVAMRGGGSPRYALLYADLDLREASQVADSLDRAHVPHQESGSGDRILVPADQVARARLLLARDGLPSGGSIGYELFDRGEAMTATEFQDQVNETRALEGELTRSIRMMEGVRAARVHLVLPRREPFARDAAPAQASVIVTTAGNRRLDAQAVQAIVNLVAAGVPGLKPQSIAVVDSSGRVLARAGAPTEGEAAAETHEEMRRALEARLDRAVEDMLEPSLGAGHVRAEAAVTMNYDQVHETQEAYNPDQQVTRSTQTVTDSSKSTEADKPVTVQNNLPNADAGQASASGSQEQRQEETTNYEIGKTVRTLVREQPQIGRISLAVMVDGETSVGADGKPAWHERSPAEIARIATLVKSAVGFDDKRGDRVDIVSMRFAPAELAPEKPALLGLEKSDLTSLAQTLILALAAMLGLFFVLRPMALRLGGIGTALAQSGTALEGQGAALALPPPPGMIADASMVEIAQIEGPVRAAAIRSIAELVDRHPEESLSIVRGWMAEARG